MRQKAKKFQREKRTKSENPKQPNLEALDEADVRIVAFLLWVLDEHKKKIN